MWKVKRMNTARIVVLANAACTGGAAAYSAGGSNPKPVEAPVALDINDVRAGATPRRFQQQRRDRNEAGKRGSVNAARYGASTPMTTRKRSRGLGR
jgi:hypothetical protein